uniref:Ig-like and fibronectin type-III domain-containing protein C25G4.10 n=1 Tax=Timema poppense TaxID=170557 RepID=A0A7R9GXW4_TIMPO|nr:unnamed protein product [Timema poppensis]
MFQASNIYATLESQRGNCPSGLVRAPLVSTGDVLLCRHIGSFRAILVRGPRLGDSVYRKGGSRLGNFGYRKGGSRLGDSGYRKGGSRLGDSGYRKEGSRLGDSGYRKGGSRLGNFGYRKGGSRLGNFGYRKGGSRLGDSGYRKGGSRLGDSGYRKEGSRLGDSGGSRLGDSGYRQGALGWGTLVTGKGALGWGTLVQGQGVRGWGTLVQDQGVLCWGALAGDSGYRKEGSRLGDSGSRLGILARSKKCVNSLVCVRWVLVVFKYRPQFPLQPIACRRQFGSYSLQMRNALVECFLLGDNKLSLLAPRYLLLTSQSSLVLSPLFTTGTCPLSTTRNCRLSTESLRAKPEMSVPCLSQSGSRALLGPRSANLSYMLKVISLDELEDVSPHLRGGRVEKKLGKNPVHPTEIRTSISPSPVVELNTTSALANHAFEAGDPDFIAGDRHTGSILGDRDTGSILSDRGTGSILSDRGTGSILSDRDAGSILSDRDAGSILGDRDTGSILSDRGTGSILSDRDAGSILSDRDAGSILSDRDAGSILSDRDAGSILCDRGTGSIPGRLLTIATMAQGSKYFPYDQSYDYRINIAIGRLRASLAPGIVSHVVCCVAGLPSTRDRLPSTRDSITHPVHVYEGDDALITCVVRDVGDNNIMWKKEDRERHIMRVLTADETRVTSDKRFDVLHDGGGDVWVLVIRTAKPTDSGVYVCEVNSKPIVRSFHKLSVLSRALLPPDNATEPLPYETQSGEAPKNHNYTDCCVSSNVSSNCFGFCNIQSILEGNTGKDPENCEADFPAIVKCMADGRNHIPCCIQEGVPDICQDVCRGEYTTITENIKTHFSCSAYTEQTLACIMEGVEILPSPPLNLEVEALSDSSFKVSWQPPQVNKATLTEYVVNVTALLSFDQDEEIVSQEEQDSYAAAADSYALAAARLRGTGEDGNDTGIALKPPTTDVFVVSDLKPPTTNVKTMGETLQVKVPGTYNFTLVNNLKPFTMYEIFVTARNIHGSSLSSYSVRTLTLTPGRLKSSQVAEAPELPDIRSCCVKKGITHPTCVDKLCDPALSDITEVTDLMICAPWAADTFSCLTNGVDHTGCCKARGLPQQCQELCAGNITQIDFSYFKCLKYMNDYTNCLLQGYGVLPSAPTQLHISNIDVNFVILHWEAPLTLGDTVKHYNLHYRQMGLEDMSYKSISMVHSPYILENLISDSMYEVFVEAVNIHGVGEPSSRAVFQTSSQLDQEKIEEASAYNLTACCLAADLTAVCMPLCSYNANMSDIKSLAGMCAGELNKLVRCGAGGRNHGDCCTRRGVPSSCLSICSGVIVDSLIVTATSCIPFIGNIVQCFEEGTGILPGPVTELHATSVTNTSVTLQWEPPSDSNASDYVIHYKKVDNITMHETVLAIDSTQNATSTISVVQGLDGGALYSFFVVSRNIHGTSLPSSVLMINVTNTDLGEKGVPSLTSPPHSLAVSAHSATWVTISWQPPEFSHPSEKLVYKLYHKSTADSSFQTVETSVTSHMVEGLSPNTQYIIYVTAVSKNGQSLPSETLIAWTDPAYPAFVEVHILQRARPDFHGTAIGPNIARDRVVLHQTATSPSIPPTVHPINLVMEGSSMTILCIAMGTPMPTISLYISGRLVRQETTRHMVTVVHNVTKDMDQISCYADNGYGTPMQASRKITISPSGITMAALGDSVVLECQVDAHPEPKMLFWRDQNGRVPVIQGGKYDINNMKAKDLLLGPGQVDLSQNRGSLSTADINPLFGDY